MPVMISLASLFIDIQIEFIALIITTSMVKVLDVILNFITIIVVSQLDEIYFAQISSSLKEKLVSQHFELPLKKSNGKALKMLNSELPIIDRAFFTLVYLV